jgi:hypothetical protein
LIFTQKPEINICGKCIEIIGQTGNYTLTEKNLYILLRIEKIGRWAIRNALILGKTGVAGSQLPRTLVRG